MFDEIRFEREFFEPLERLDEQISRRVAAGGCAECGGPLHRANFERKPRGGVSARAGETSVTRFGLCCGREGCRKRALPPSLRFLGRRVYVGVVVIVASIAAMGCRKSAEVRRLTGVPGRTVARWLGWWRGPFVTTEVFVSVCARLVGVAIEELPASVVLRFGGSALEKVRAMLDLVAPLTTKSVAAGSRFLRDAV